MSERVDCIVIGAGVIGLAVARALALAGREVVILEAESAIGTATSSRNSEVIHAGLYYPPGSLKARMCVEGRRRLYAYLIEHGIEHRRCGKLICATAPDQIEALCALEARARGNGVDDLRWLDADEARAMEPALACVAAVLSPSTGILDTHAYMLSLQGEAEEHGAVVAFQSPVVGGRAVADGVEMEVGGEAPMWLRARHVVNASGLGAQAVAASIVGVHSESVPPLHYAKGNYFHLTGRPPFSRLIYPVPGTASLGVHYTVDLGGQGRFGPDVEWVPHIDYDVDPARGERFYAAVRQYWPDLPDGALQPGYSGVRPKLQAPGEPPADFVIQGPEVHGVDGLVNLFGIESPGLTSSLAIADEVRARLT